ncbi:MAG: TonB-dependent siderophore receptor [Usitatibacter sp.]
MAHRYRFPRRPLHAALIAAIASPAVSLAQSAPEPEQKLPEVKVTTPSEDTSFLPEKSTVGAKGAPAEIRDIPQSVTVINKAVMESQGAMTLADVLRNVPGITMGAAEGGAIGNNINLRGFTARTDVYLDGMRDRGQYFRDIFSLESVEVLKGPSSMLFGRGSTGGVINQVSKAASKRPYDDVSLTLGTAPTFRVTADLNSPLSDTSAARISLMGQEAHSTRDEMVNKDFGAAPTATWGIGTPTEITLSALLQHNDDMADYGLPPVNGHPAPVDRDTFFGLTDDRTIQEVGQLSLRIRHKLDKGLTIRNQTQYIDYKIDARETGPNSVGTLVNGVYTPIPNGNNTGNATNVPVTQLYAGMGPHDRAIKDTSFYNQTDLISEFMTGSVGHALIGGLEFGRDTYDNQASTRTDPAIGVAPGVINVFFVMPLVAPSYAPMASTVVSTKGNLADATADAVGVYVNDTMALTRQWKIVAGVRWDRYKASITNTITAPLAANQTVDFTSVRAGVLYQPTETSSYYASYGTSFNPSLETLTAASGQQGLAPEESKTCEVGAKWDLYDGNLSLTSAIFDTEKDNARSLVSTGVYELTGDIRVRGFEAELAGRITRDWQVLAGYTYLDAKIIKASALDNTLGKVPLNTPKNSATLWTTYSVTRQWEVGGGFTYMSERFANNTDIVSVPGYLRFDATLAYHQRSYDIRLNLMNIANRLNYDLLIPSDGGRAVPGVDRSALLTYTYKF